MPVEITKESAGLVVLRMSSKLTEEELERVQDTAIEMLETQASLKILVLLESFEGWEKSEAWGDVTFLSTTGDKISKMAFVGDLKWRDEMFMFTGKGLRSTEIEFFEARQAADARTWINAG